MLKSFDFILRMSVFEGLWIGGSCPQILIAVVYNTIHFFCLFLHDRGRNFFLLGAHELNRLTNDLNQSQHILLVSDLKKKKKKCL